MTNRLESSMILEELGFEPMWLLKQKAIKPKKIYHSYTLNLTRSRILFIGESTLTLPDNELDLFKNIALYLHGQSINESLRLSLSLDYIKMKDVQESLEYDYLFALGRESEFLDKINNENVFVSSSLEEMLNNSESKKKLWQDIQQLLTKITG